MQPTPALTFPQIRAKLAQAIYQTYTHLELCKRLRAVGMVLEHPLPTRRSLAMRYAWVLLPSGPGERGKK